MSTLVVDRVALAEAATWVSAAISNNPPSPQLAGFRLKVEVGQIAVTGFDHDTLRQAALPVDGGEFDTVVSARFLREIVGALKGDAVTLELDQGRLTVSSARASYSARTMDPRDYPALPSFPTHMGTVDAGSLADLLGTVEHAVSRDVGLKALAAYNIAGEAGVLTVAATDRFRLARATANWADASGAKFEVNVPGPALHAAAKSLRGEVQIGATETAFGLADEGRVIITRVLGSEHKFPRIAPLFDKQPVAQVEVEVATFAEALKRSQLVADETGMVHIEFSDGLITVHGDSETGGGVEEVDCALGFGEGVDRYKFSGRNFLDALLACPSPRVTLGLSGVGQQVLLDPVGVESSHFIVMSRRAV